MGRARLALDIVAERLQTDGVAMRRAALDLIGVDALHAGGERRAAPAEPYEVRAQSRPVGSRRRRRRRRIGEEVEALYTNGPAGGGGAIKSVREILAIGVDLCGARARAVLRAV